MWNGKGPFPIYRCPIAIGCAKISKRACWAATKNAPIIRAIRAKASAIIGVRRCSSVATSQIARKAIIDINQVIFLPFVVAGRCWSFGNGFSFHLWSDLWCAYISIDFPIFHAYAVHSIPKGHWRRQSTRSKVSMRWSGFSKTSTWRWRCWRTIFHGFSVAPARYITVRTLVESGVESIVSVSQFNNNEIGEYQIN